MNGDEGLAARRGREVQNFSYVIIGNLLVYSHDSSVVATVLALTSEDGSPDSVDNSNTRQPRDMKAAAFWQSIVKQNQGMDQ